MRLAILRPVDRLEASVALAEDMGFNTITASPLATVPNDNAITELMFKLLQQNEFDHVVITSSAGVSSVLTLADKYDVDIVDLLNKYQLTAIGPATAEAMLSAGMKVDTIPAEYTSTGVVNLLISEDIIGKSVCLIRSDHGDPILVTGLQDAGAIVLEVPIYRLMVRPDNKHLIKMVQETLSGDVNAFAFSSAMTASTFIEAAKLIGKEKVLKNILNECIVSAIGPPTEKKLNELGIKVDVMPEQATFKAMLEAIRDFSNSQH
ncbi:MAG: uroporphyrinogen-III synthase [Euryarchaeota archaeon]|nr:uroporphyrinogen-III synthase [Euryarchaeota archaeon]